MPQGFLSARIDTSNERHHLWLNNGTYWCHYVLNFDFRTRRIRRSLGTKSLPEAIRRRDQLFAKLQTEGEWVEARESKVSRLAEVERALVTFHETAERNPTLRWRDVSDKCPAISHAADEFTSILSRGGEP